MSSVKKVLIVGGGIGGLSSGIALKRAGIDVEIAEIQPAFNIYGVGIIQTSNALRALDALGVVDKCLERGSPYGMVKMCTANGFQFTEIGVPPIGRLPSHNGVSRRILHEILYEAATELNVPFRMGLSVQKIDNQENNVRVTFTDGTTGEYDLLIGADGVNSKVRGLIFGEYKAQYTGQSVWRYAFKRLANLDTGYMFMGKNTKAGLIPMTKDDMYMFLVSGEGENPWIDEDRLIPRFTELLKEYDAPMIKECVPEIVNPKAVIYRPLETLLLPAPWYKNRVIIIGDAAHATIPQLGQGAGLALEDSVVLAELLQEDSSLQSALEKYMQRRYERCKMVVDVSKQIGEWEQLDWNRKLPEGANIGALMGRTLGALMQPI